MTINGTPGNDNLTGTSGNDTFELWQGGNDTASGLAGDDIFVFNAAFTAADSIDGGAGNDTLRLAGNYSSGVTLGAATMVNVETIQLGAGFSYSLTTNDANVALNNTLSLNASALSAANFVTFNGAAETNGVFHLTGGAGNDSLTGGAKNDIIDDTRGGSDTASGGAGNDIFDFAAAYDTTDSVDGGAGGDSLRLVGDYSTQTTLGSLTGVEQIQVGPGFSYDLLVPSTAGTLQINGQTLGASDTLTVDGREDTAGGLNVIGGAGNDVIFGTQNIDTIDITHGGSDHIDLSNSGGQTGGPDIVNANTAFDASDVIIGGDNTLLRLDGDYSAGVTANSTTLQNVDEIQFAAGHNYKIILAADSGVITVLGASVGAANTIYVDASAETNAMFNMIGGAGNDTFIGTAQADRFTMSAGGDDTVSGGGGNDIVSFQGALTAGDTVDGGAGFDTVEYTGVDNTIYGPTHFTNVEQSEIDLFGNQNYNLTLGAGDLVTGDRFIVAGELQDASHNTNFDASARTAGNITFMGGAGNDTINLGAFVSSGDSIEGGVGNDTVIVTISSSPVFTTSSNDFHSIETVDNVLTAGHSYVLSGGGVSGTNFEVDGSALTSPDTLDFTGGGGDIAVTAIGGAGNDTLSNGTAATAFLEGGGGADTLNLNGSDAAKLVYDGASDSTGNAYDTITGFSVAQDTFSLGVIPTGYDGAHAEPVDAATFNASMTALADDAGLQAHHAIIITDTTAGALNGHNFLIVDVNGDAHYNAGTDYLIDLGTDSVAGFGTANFF